MRSDAVAASPPRPVELLPEGAPRGGSRSPIGPRLIHVVDPTESVRSVTVSLLEVGGFAVESFADGRTALEASRARVPDVLIMEPRAPGADALAVMAGWRSAHGAAAPPVVWCTAVTPSPEQVGAAASLGLRGVVVKPFLAAGLAALVVRVCRTAEREQRLFLLGVGPLDLAALLVPEVTRLWLRVEVDLADEHARPLSVVAVGSSTMEVVTAVRLVVRAVDLLGHTEERTLLVLLPDVDEAGAATVARRVEAAVAGLTPRPAVAAVTRAAGEDALALLARAVSATMLGAIGT